MAENGHCFVEWKEQFVSKERGNRVVHYFLKDISGESILAVVGTERSVRHMFYVVSDEFLNVQGADYSVHAGFRWRSRREVVNWLTSRLSKQHRHGDRSNKLPKDDLITEASGEQTPLPDYRGSLARNLKGHSSDIVWSGVSWTCGKQLRHYAAFCRNGIKIAIHSFVFVMAEEGNHYLAYIEDMYEDRKGQKKVKVRWFHRTQEIKRVISLRNPHPKEVFITPYAQVISVECVDGPAIVLAPEDYEKCLAGFPSNLLARLHLCYRQFKSNRVKPFKLSKLRGYLDQPIFSCLDPDSDDEELSPGDNVQVGVKRARRAREPQILTYESSFRNLKRRRLISHNFKVNEKVELLCQDSGIRGCWFRCTVLQVSQRQLKVQYDDLKDEDGCGNLEEWVPAFRLAMPDKLGMRCPGRQTIRPSLSNDEIDLSLEVGAPVDAWWSDGWWEGVVTGIIDTGNESLQVYIPGEDLVLNVMRKNLRVSRDWMGDQWVDIDANHDILSAISAAVSQDTKITASPTIVKEPNSDDLPKLCPEAPISTKLDVVEEDKVEPLDDLVPCDYVAGDIDQVNDEKQSVVVERDNINLGDESPEKGIAEHDHNDHDKVENQNADADNSGSVGDGEGGENEHKLEEFETAGQKCESELLEVVA